MQKLFSWLYHLILPLLLFLPGAVLAADPLRACFVTWIPYTQLEDGKPEGITVDLLKEAAKRAKFDLTFKGLPWKRCLAMVQRGEMDFAMDAVDRPGFIHGKHPSALYILGFWIRKSEDYGQFEYMGKLLDKRLGLLQGFQYSEKILDAGFPVIEWLPSESVAAKMVAINRLDLAFADAVVMQQVINKFQLPLKPMLPVFSIQPLYPSFNVSMTKKRDRIDQALGEMHEDGTVDQIYTRHTGVSFSEFVKMGSENMSPSEQ
ncbi:ABC transporter substrate-binding protein [Motiliproteus sp. MSK22-1]|uniref:substrate-binding periplasmic protein n=1 Tax=Motiliproteus sp. MSK22-1 TaxID=1897630 RepID=UPI000978B3A4|nr:transporter substrate-binding domain-containing protein [Motiliproteus sp. MSK22-1]OMH36201.1 hypothetical protein BGP75_10195 [Motiliproteus sp. MSK22-1]